VLLIPICLSFDPDTRAKVPSSLFRSTMAPIAVRIVRTVHTATQALWIILSPHGDSARNIVSYFLTPTNNILSNKLNRTVFLTRRSTVKSYYDLINGGGDPNWR